ncbi:hypothetical protein BDBG_16695 [Blastomyces gilchristii SLH14081]|uniref:Uncharacterized protein n=1 Tax=Blastomyces gilchristii (strain SLH14081) TaxID=559298 RepID=A0A179UIC9_BLAGS|nr:uncharacterized protein BDBG_16695 [Blastomyces gilchristii SLH14081]OAT06791.1 hypothetical protein BDBG_16695 [Blastomyces gilchristii SLH14081]
MLIERESDVIIAAEKAEKELNTVESTDRRNDTSLQDTASTATAARNAGEEEEDVIIRVILSQSVNTAVSAFNLTFLAVTETAAAS